MEELTLKMAPHVYEASIQAARVDALSHILGGLFTLCLFGLSVWAEMVFWEKVKKANDPEGWLAAMLFVGLIGLMCGVVGPLNLLNPINWIGLWEPEVYLAAKVLF